MNISRTRIQVAAGAAAILAAGLVTWAAWPDRTPAAASTTAATCPTINSRIPNNPTSDDLRHILVPDGPTRATICGYTTDPWATSAPARVVTIGRDQAEQLATALNAGVVLPVHDVSTCPRDDGTGDRIVFGYPSGRTVTVVVDRSGCRFATNGFDPPEDATTVWMTVEAQQQLASLVG